MSRQVQETHVESEGVQPRNGQGRPDRKREKC